MKYQHVTLIIMAVLAVAALFWFLNSKKSCRCDNEYDYEETRYTLPGHNLDIVPKKCPSGTYKQTINGMVACLGKGQNEGCYTTRNSSDGGKHGSATPGGSIRENRGTTLTVGNSADDLHVPDLTGLPRDSRVQKNLNLLN